MVLTFDSQLLDFMNPIADSLKTGKNMGIMRFLTINKQYYGIHSWLNTMINIYTHTQTYTSPIFILFSEINWKLAPSTDAELEFLEFTSSDQIRVEKKYDGVFIYQPLSMPQLHSMITMFKQKKVLFSKYT